MWRIAPGHQTRIGSVAKVGMKLAQLRALSARPQPKSRLFNPQAGDGRPPYFTSDRAVPPQTHPTHPSASSTNSGEIGRPGCGSNSKTTPNLLHVDTRLSEQPQINKVMG